MSLAKRARKNTLAKISALSLLSLALQQAQATCVLNASAGDTNSVCSSGTSATGLTDYEGDNSLTLPASGTGTINGNITTGDGADVVEMHSGSINGEVSQGAGIDHFLITAGTVTGEVYQGDGTDDFVMHGGQIQSLSQGDNRDTFLMTDGTIVGAFLDGDVAKQTGGSIGRVDMKLDNNIYEMTAGTILGNLVTGFGTDTIIMSGGSIGGNISVSGGNDSITVSGGVIEGEIRASTGDDSFTWLGGTINSAVLMGDGDDSAVLIGLHESLLSSTPSIDGGLGNDQLTFDNTRTATTARYIGWETVHLSNQSHMDLAGDFFLGDSASNTGVIQIDSSSVLAVKQGKIRPYTSGQLVTLNNAGVIDMTTSSNAATDSLRVYGNYVGSNGQLKLQTVLGDDKSVTDKLIVSDGRISGNTQLAVTNLGGLGGLTKANGIEVVQALNGAVSTSDAFSLKGSLSAGAYEYYLFKGGVTAGSENSWFLRSAIVAVEPPVVVPPPPVVPPEPPIVEPPVVEPPVVEPPAPEPPIVEPPVVTPPITEPPVVEPAPPTLPEVDPDEPPVEPPTPQPVPPIEVAPPPAPELPAESLPEPAPSTPELPPALEGEEPIPLYRQEVPLYSAQIPAAQMVSLEALGTFHDRQGEQSLLTETGALSSGWVRAYGSDVDRSWSGTASPSFDGSVKGYQIGHDLYSSETRGERIQRFGLFVGQSRLDGDVKGFTEGFKDRDSGRIKLDADHLGAYWTLTDPKGWYVDLVAMGSRFDGDNKSERGVKTDSEGDALAVSAEVGYPVQISPNWVVEPQAQVIYQHIDMDSQHDGIAHVAFDAQDYATGRIGARLKGRYQVGRVPLEPYVRINAWHTFDGTDTVTYDGFDRIKSEHKSSYADIGVGVVARFSPAVSAYMAADYNTHLDDNERDGGSGNLGIRISW